MKGMTWHPPLLAETGWVASARLLILGAFQVSCFVIVALALMRAAWSEEIEGRFFRITGEVSFDGEAIAYDDTIEVYISEKALAESAGLWSRSSIVRPLKAGGALMLEVPDVAGLWLDLQKGVKPRPQWKDPSYVERRLRPPPEFLPEFYWINRLADPTVVEAYISESYYSQPKPRLKVLRPIRIEYVAPTTDAAQTAAEQKAAEPPIDLLKGRHFGSPGYWIGFTLLPVEAAVWSRVPEVVHQIEAASAENLVVLDRPSVEKLYSVAWPIYRAHWGDSRSEALGVPQPRKFPQPKGEEGMILGQWMGHYGDGRIPVRCDPSERCMPLTDQRGFYIFYDKLRHPMLSVGQHSLDLAKVPAFYARDANLVYVIGKDGF